VEEFPEAIDAGLALMLTVGGCSELEEKIPHPVEKSRATKHDAKSAEKNRGKRLRILTSVNLVSSMPA